MKQTRLWLTTITVLLCSLTASAHNFEMGGIYYDITSSTNLTVAVTYKGSKWNTYNEYTGVVTIPESVVYNNITYRVTSIGGSAFSGCTSLTSIIIPESVTSIEDYAFYDCSSLTSLVIPDGVTSIGGYAFFGCEKLSSIIIGKNVSSIGANAFMYTHNTTLYLDRIINYSNIFFSNNYSDSEQYGIYGSLLVNVNECTNIDDFLFKTTGEEIALVAYIGSKTELILPSSFNGEKYIIGSYAFSKTNIANVIIPNNVKTIKNKAFYGCGNLHSVVTGNGVTSVETEAFGSCDNLSSLTIGSNVSTIGSSAFAGCNEIESIYAFNPKAISSDESIFSTDAYNNAILYVPTDRVFAYEKATPWSKFQIKPMKTFAITYMVDGKVYETEEVEYGADVTLIEEPIKEGYTFTGWSEVPETMPAENIVVNGSFIANKYLVTFKIGDEVVTSDSLEYGTAIVIPEVTEREGYTFSGWGDVPETVPASDVTYEGSYLVNSYKLTYMVDGDTYHEVTKEYGAAIEPVENPTKEGHTFSGWSEALEAMPAHDVTINAIFTVNKYIVTFQIGNEVIAANTLEYGTAIVAPEAPEKEGYFFNGWGEVAETVPANDVVYEGSYSVNSYKLTYIIDGEIIKESMVAYGAVIELIEGPNKAGYAFDGWSEVPETMPANDVVIYGTYTKLFVETMAINDSDSRFSMADDTECGTIIYIRNFSSTDWQTLYIPFELPYDEICDEFEVADINNVHQYDHNDDGETDETVIEAFKVTSGTLEANYPYLIRAKEAGRKMIMLTDATLYVTEENSIDCSSVREKFTFTGTYSLMTSDALIPGEGYYTLIDGEWQSVTEETTLGAFRFYLKVDSRNSHAMMARTIRMRIVGENGSDDDATGIENSQLTIQNSQFIYDLQGRRVENPTKGIYIVNGKKTVIK